MITGHQILIARHVRPQGIARESHQARFGAAQFDRAGGPRLARPGLTAEQHQQRLGSRYRGIEQERPDLGLVDPVGLGRSDLPVGRAHPWVLGEESSPLQRSIRATILSGSSGPTPRNSSRRSSAF